MVLPEERRDGGAAGTSSSAGGTASKVGSRAGTDSDAWDTRTPVVDVPTCLELAGHAEGDAGDAGRTATHS